MPEYAHTRIVATIGPASEPRIGELLDAGMSVARINFSHEEHDAHRRRVELLRAAAVERGRSVGILADIQGPKLRLARMVGGARRVRRGDRLILREGDGVAEEGELYVNVEGFDAAVCEGQRVFLADGVVELVVEGREDGGSGHWARVRRGGPLGDRKGVNLPDSELDFELPTEKDRLDLAAAREMGVDLIGVSFVKDGADVRAVRELAPDALIVAKIERASAVDALDDILLEADGVMVARGDLGVEVELERLPMIQKDILAQARRAGKFAITATEMLESMVHAPRPTRAEAADVANAVLDGTDAVMLSAETAVGEYPVEAVETMRGICRAVESTELYAEYSHVAFRASERDFSNATAHAAVEAAEALGIERIICFTESGNTARLLSRYRPQARVIALSPIASSLARMCLLSHVTPIDVHRENNLEDMLAAASQMLLERGLARLGDPVVFVAGVPPGVSRTTNVMKLHRIGEPIRLA